MNAYVYRKEQTFSKNASNLEALLNEGQLLLREMIYVGV